MAISSKTLDSVYPGTTKLNRLKENFVLWKLNLHLLTLQKLEIEVKGERYSQEDLKGIEQ
jgi:hypothetical protein